MKVFSHLKRSSDYTTIDHESGSSANAPSPPTVDPTPFVASLSGWYSGESLFLYYSSSFLCGSSGWSPCCYSGYLYGHYSGSSRTKTQEQLHLSFAKRACYSSIKMNRLQQAELHRPKPLWAQEDYDAPESGGGFFWDQPSIPYTSATSLSLGEGRGEILRSDAADPDQSTQSRIKQE